MNLVPDMTTPVFHASLDEPIGEPRGVHVWAYDLNAADHDRMDRGDWLSPDERSRVQRLRRPEDRRRFLRSHAITRHLLAGVLRQPARDIAFGRGAHGKPFIEQATAPGASLDFNVSHSENAYLLGVCFGGTVGVDVETVRDMPDWMSVAESFFSPDATASLRAAPSSERPDLFFRYWTLKEAYEKSAGRGLVENTRTVTPGIVDGWQHYQAVVSFGDGRAAAAIVWTTEPCHHNRPRQHNPTVRRN